MHLVAGTMAEISIVSSGVTTPLPPFDLVAYPNMVPELFVWFRRELVCDAGVVCCVAAFVTSLYALRWSHHTSCMLWRKVANINVS